MAMKISFIIAAHNEEKVIAQPLQNLLNLPYKNYEVVIGLDGCTDRTEEIVKTFVKKKPKIFKYYLLNERKGKPAVVNKIIPKATGEIIIINDADWVFTATEQQIKEIVSFFEDPKVGGLAQRMALEYSKKLRNSKSLGFHTVAHSSQLWLDYMAKTQTRKGYVHKMLYPFLVNIFRRELYKDNETLGDDFERAYDILKAGYRLRLIPKYHVKMEPVYDDIKLKDVFKIRVRTAQARTQIHTKYKMKAGLLNFYIPLQAYFLLRWPFLKDWRAQLGMPIWLGMMYLSFVINLKNRKKSTKEGWTLRAER